MIFTLGCSINIRRMNVYIFSRHLMRSDSYLMKFLIKNRGDVDDEKMKTTTKDQRYMRE